MPDATMPNFSDWITDLVWMFEDGEFIYLLVGGLVLLMVSRRVIEERPRVEQWGRRLGIVAFVWWYIRDVANNGIWGAEQLVTTGFRGLLVMQYSVAATWLILAIATCVWTEILTRVTQWFTSLLKGVSAISRKPLDAWRKHSMHVEETEDQRNRRSVERRLGEQRAEHESQQAETRKREACERAELRYGVELLYDRYRAELRDKLPPERFEAYFNNHLTNELPVDIYAHRAEQLKNMIRDRLEVRQKNDLPEFNSIEDIIEHFRIRREKLKFLNLDPDTLETMEIAIDDAQDRELRKFLS